MLVIDLADRFQISKTIAADIFLEILNISIKWSHPELQIFMPVSFRSKFDSEITAIVDWFELSIDRPSILVQKYLHGQLTKGTILKMH